MPVAALLVGQPLLPPLADPPGQAPHSARNQVLVMPPCPCPLTFQLFVCDGSLKIVWYEMICPESAKRIVREARGILPIFIGVAYDLVPSKGGEKPLLGAFTPPITAL